MFSQATSSLLAQTADSGGASWLLQWGLPLLGILLITTGLLYRYQKKRRESSGRITAREHLERMKQEKGIRGDLESLMVEIEQLARRMGAQLDAKVVQIEKLLREADERIAHLESLSSARQGPPAEAGPAEARHPHGNPSRPGPSATDAGSAAGAALSEPPDPLTRSVLELAAEGHPAPEIARRLDEHVGKVELILALQRAR